MRVHGTRIRKPDKGNDTLNPSESCCKHSMHTLYKITHATRTPSVRRIIHMLTHFDLLIK